ncbi:MAG: sulfotransferase domain-containing protein [Bacteroidota bacterium]
MIWLASFPRSGNTFMRNVLFQVYGLESSAIHEKNLEQPGDRLTFPIVKTHLMPHQVAHLGAKPAVIYLVRDGRDALVSLAHHRSNIVAPGSDFHFNLSEALKAKEGSFFGGWHQNVLDWIQKADVIVRFEDLIQDPMAQMERIESVLSLPARVERIELPTFDTQKFGNPRYGPNGEKKTLFFRKGKIGDWKEEMPQRLQKAFWYKSGPLMELLGYTPTGEIEALPPLDRINGAAQMLGPAPEAWYEKGIVGKMMDHWPRKK